MGDDESRIAGTMIRRHREAAGLTQHDLARAAGVSVGVIRDFEQGRTTRLRPKSADGLRAHIGIGWSLAEQNRYPEALRHSRLAMRLFARASDQHGRAGALNNIGWFHILAGDAEAGIGYCVQARDLFGEIANREGEAIAWDSIGQGQQRLTRHPQAIASFRRAVRIFRDIGDQYHLADSLANLGDAQRDAGQHAAAARSWREALDILDGMSHPAADRIRDSLRALG